MFTGLVLGQLFFGPASDTIGRRLPIVIGFLVFIIGCIIAAMSTNLPTMLTGRFIQGFGLAAPAAVRISIVRDLYQGDEMARIMSFIMTVFIFVPVIAVYAGAGIPRHG